MRKIFTLSCRVLLPIESCTSLLTFFNSCFVQRRIDRVTVLNLIVQKKLVQFSRKQYKMAQHDETCRNGNARIDKNNNMDDKIPEVIKKRSGSQHSQVSMLTFDAAVENVNQMRLYEMSCQQLGTLQPESYKHLQEVDGNILFRPAYDPNALGIRPNPLCIDNSYLEGKDLAGMSLPSRTFYTERYGETKTKENGNYRNAQNERSKSSNKKPNPKKSCFISDAPMWVKYLLVFFMLTAIVSCFFYLKTGFEQGYFVVIPSNSYSAPTPSPFQTQVQAQIQDITIDEPFNRTLFPTPLPSYQELNTPSITPALRPIFASTSISPTKASPKIP